jgi:hypothetical protein
MKKLAYFTLALVSIIALGIAIHIKDVTKNLDERGKKQLARIDLSLENSSIESNEVTRSINQIEAVTHSFYNPISGRLIFSFNPQTHNPEEIYRTFLQNTSWQASLYKPDGKLVESACPF